ncbi:MAG: GHKL domain-containing protein [Provencibacterium sp.]|jgi:two-component system sensor histidine kinase CiaH|nr:GHKL domain-containing protein [Provencibacterium sp.]
MINRLRRQFIIIAMLSVTLVMFLMALSINVFNYLSTDRALSNTLQMIYENQGMIPQFPGRKQGKPPRGQFTAETPYSTRYFVLYYNENGTLNMADMKHIAAVAEEDTGRFLSAALSHGEGTGYLEAYKYYVIHTDDNRYMAIFLDCQRELHSVRTFAFISLLVAVTCVLLVYILIWFFSKKAIEPAVKSMEKQKQFITDASHELKTPLTVIATSLKVLEMEVGEQKWIGKAQTQTEKMSELVNNLVTLARLDEEKTPLRFVRFDISSMVVEIAESFRDFAAARGHTLEVDAISGLSCCGDEYALRQLVSILLDNAVKYADDGGTIRLSLERSKKGMVLKASNPCAGLDEGELSRLFDRFYRPDRSRSKQTGGFGVGLSIALGIVEAHKGSIRAECPAKGMIQFVVLLR